MLRRLFKWGAIALAAIVIAVGGLIWWLGRSGSNTIERWIGSEIQTIANGYLNPKLSFDSPDYTYPYSVSLKHFRLTGVDPVTQQPVDVISCDSALVTLAAIPKIGQPIVIEKISLQQPTIRAIAVGPESPDYIGFSHLMADPTTRPIAPEHQGRAKLSDAFAMKLVELVDAKIVYDPRIAGTVPMELDKISTSLKIAPTETGTYQLDTLITKEPVFAVKVSGQLNLDTFAAKDLQLGLSADLGADKLDYLPPQLQKLMKQYDARGKLTVNVSGDMPVMEPTKGKVNASIRMTKANVSTGDLRLPVEMMTIDTSYADGSVTFKEIKLAALGGTIDITGKALLNDRLDADLTIDVANLVPERILTHATDVNAGDNPATLNCKVKIAGALYSIMGEAPKPPGIPLASISVQDFSLTANDPANPGQKLDVAACKNVNVILGEPVVAGKPIVIDKIVLDDPVLSAVAVDPRSPRFVGIPKLPVSVTAATGPAISPAISVAVTPPAAPSGPKKTWSDLYRVGRFEINNAKLVYDPRIPGTRRMWLGGINTSLFGTDENPSVYTLAVKLGRPGEFDFSLGAKVDLDHPAVHDLAMNMVADLTGTALDFLPPELQTILQQADANGKMTLNVAADIPLNDLPHATAKADLRIDKIRLSNADGSLLPVDHVALAARVGDGLLVIPTCEIAAAGSTFAGSGSASLASPMPLNFKLSLKDVPIEKTLAALQPGVAIGHTSTRLSADVELQSPVLAAIGLTPSNGSPIATAIVRNIRLTADDPGASTPVDFVKVDSFKLTVNGLPAPGQPLSIGEIAIDKPALRAIASAPNSKTLIGLSNIQAIVAAEPKPAPSAVPWSQFIQIGSFTVNGASIYYDPKIDKTVPMSISNLSMAMTRLDDAERYVAMASSIPLDPLAMLLHPSTGSDVYGLRATVPAEPTMKVDVAGKIVLDDFRLTGLAIDSTIDLAHRTDGVFPPQVQQMMEPSNPAGVAHVHVTGETPLTNPTAGDVRADVAMDNVAFTVNNYRVPVDRVRLPVRLTRNHAVFLPAGILGGPTVQVIGGTINVTGDVTLDDRLTSTLKIDGDDLDLDRLMHTQISGQKPDIVGYASMRANLTNAPILVAVAHAAPLSIDVKPPPFRFVMLPDQWGTVHLEVEHARLAGLEVIQRLGAAARTAFAQVMNLASKNDQINITPKEKASLVFDLQGDRGVFSTLYYEGEVVVVEGIKDKCSFTLDQNLDMRLQGGPIAKLGEHGGRFGNWIKDATNSLYTFVITGPAINPSIAVETGDGKPIVDATKNIAGKGVDAAGKGLNAAGSGIKKGWGWITGNH